MYIYEAYAILEEKEPTFDNLMKAHEVMCVEKGYLLAIAIRNAETCGSMELEQKIWKLALCIQSLQIKIQNTIN